MNVKGAIKVIKDTQVVSERFSKRELVVTVQDGNYSNDILIEFNNNQCSLLDSFLIGDSVEVDINLKGRCWLNPQGEEKYFNTINGWKIAKL